jgi:hypothetical protein
LEPERLAGHANRTADAEHCLAQANQLLANNKRDWQRRNANQLPQLRAS